MRALPLVAAVDPSGLALDSLTRMNSCVSARAALVMFFTAVACASDAATDESPTNEETEAEPSREANDGSLPVDAARAGRTPSPSSRADAAMPRADAASSATKTDANATPSTQDDAGTAECAAPRSRCASACVDTSSDAEHCGSCGHACASGESCAAGECRQAESCSDSCVRQGGVEWACKTRFMYGLNYAWHHFGSDFGGNAAWQQPGVSRNAKVEAELAAFAANGVSVLRWWMLPDFRGDGVSFDASDAPTGVGGTMVADIERALELADDYDLYVMLTLFSFDNFRPTKTADGRRSRGIRDMLRDPAKRMALLERVVRPIARAAAASRHAKRLIAWDVINEPEWAMEGASLYGGDPAFDPNPELEAVSHTEMESFLRDVIAVLRAESEALVSVGATAVKWRHAWSKLDVDFHQFHFYEWVNMYWPYNRTPADYGIGDKPVVMGEFPARGLASASYDVLVSSWYMQGYQGALAWSYTDPMFGGAGVLPDVKRFADRHPCETQF